MSSDTEFTQFEELDRLSDADLEKIVIEGVNLHIHMSKASVAKRILENRRQKKQLEVVENVQLITKQMQHSQKELSSLVEGLDEIKKSFSF